MIAVAVELGKFPDEVAEHLTREGLEELFAFFKMRREAIEEESRRNR